MKRYHIPSKNRGLVWHELLYKAGCQAMCLNVSEKPASAKGNPNSFGCKFVNHRYCKRNDISVPCLNTDSLHALLYAILGMQRHPCICFFMNARVNVFHIYFLQRRDNSVLKCRDQYLPAWVCSFSLWLRAKTDPLVVHGVQKAFPLCWHWCRWRFFPTLATTSLSRVKAFKMSSRYTSHTTSKLNLAV